MGCAASNHVDKSSGALPPSEGAAEKHQDPPAPTDRGAASTVNKIENTTIAALNGVVDVVAVGRDSPPLRYTCKVFSGEVFNGTLEYPELSDGPFGIPELQAKANIGICLSGGGMRAVTTHLGVVRALHQLGYLRKARYIVSSSGAGWLNGPLSFQGDSPVDLDTFLGPYIPPEDLTTDVLDSPARSVGQEGSFAAVAADASIAKSVLGHAVANLATLDWGDNEARGWTKGVASAFLAPYGLEDVERSTVTALGTRGAVHTRVEAAAAAAGLKVYRAMTDSSMPFPIIAQCILDPNDPRVYFPFEFTPLYAGGPAALQSSQAARFGGGWVEPLGLNTTLVKQPEQPVGCGEGSDVEVERTGPYSLAEALGISSGYLSYMSALGKDEKEVVLTEMLGNHVLQYWSQQDWTTRETLFTDSGGTDYLGIYTMLRRKVTTVFVSVASQVAPGDELHTWALGHKEVAALFGEYPGGKEKGLGKDKVPAGLYNRCHQVFAGVHLEGMYRDLQACAARGGPLWHRARYDVMDNEFQGVRGGWQVAVLFLFNSRDAQWESALPPDTQQRLAADRASKIDKVAEDMAGPVINSDLHSFPLMPTMKFNYSPQLVCMMANHSAWAVRQVAEQLTGLMGSC